MLKLCLALCLLLASCQNDQIVMAKRKADLDADQDRQCQSFGAKKGTPEYIHCRETLYAEGRKEDAQRRQLAAAYLMSHPLGNLPPPPQMASPDRSVNCTSSVNGIMMNTTCY